MVILFLLSRALQALFLGAWLHFLIRRIKPGSEEYAYVTAIMFGVLITLVPVMSFALPVVPPIFFYAILIQMVVFQYHLNFREGALVICALVALIVLFRFVAGSMIPWL